MKLQGSNDSIVVRMTAIYQWFFHLSFESQFTSLVLLLDKRHVSNKYLFLNLESQGMNQCWGSGSGSGRIWCLWDTRIRENTGSGSIIHKKTLVILIFSLYKIV